MAKRRDLTLAKTEIETENVTVLTWYRGMDNRWKTAIALSADVLAEFKEPPRTTVLGVAYSTTEDEAKIMHERCVNDVYRNSWQEDVRMLLAGLEPVGGPDVEL